MYTVKFETNKSPDYVVDKIKDYHGIPDDFKPKNSNVTYNKIVRVNKYSGIRHFDWEVRYTLNNN